MRSLRRSNFSTEHSRNTFSNDCVVASTLCVHGTGIAMIIGQMPKVCSEGIVCIVSTTRPEPDCLIQPVRGADRAHMFYTNWSPAHHSSALLTISRHKTHTIVPGRRRYLWCLVLCTIHLSTFASCSNSGTYAYWRLECSGQQ
jgi:hypothetical protein